MDETSVDLTHVTDAANQIMEKAEVPCEAYPDSERGANARLRWRLDCDSLTRQSRAASPVLPAPGVGQVGRRLESSWGLEEEEDEEDENMSGEETKTAEQQQQERKHTGGGLLLSWRSRRWSKQSHSTLTKGPLSAGDVVELSDSEEEEVVLLHP